MNKKQGWLGPISRTVQSGCLVFKQHDLLNNCSVKNDLPKTWLEPLSLFHVILSASILHLGLLWASAPFTCTAMEIGGLFSASKTNFKGLLSTIQKHNEKKKTGARI